MNKSAKYGRDLSWGKVFLIKELMVVKETVKQIIIIPYDMCNKKSMDGVL